MNRRFSTLLCAAALCAGLGRAAVAQITPELLNAAPTNEAKQLRRIALKNVPPSWVAWWLDPLHNTQPPQFKTRQSAENSKPEILEKGELKNDVFALPEGVDQIVAVETQKSLLVLATEAGFEELQKIVQFLDRPLRQVEIETEVVQIRPEDADALGVDYVTQENLKGNSNGFGPEISAPKNGLQIGIARGNFQATLSASMAQNKAKLVASQRVLTINNTQSEIRPFDTIPGATLSAINFQKTADLSTQLPQGDGYKNLFLPFFDPNTIQVVKPLGEPRFYLLATPTINNDETVTLLMSLLQPPSHPAPANESSAVMPKPGELEVIANARDGETLVLDGLESSFSGAAQNPTKPATNLMVFITSRIVRRVSDDVSVDAPQP